MFAVVPIFALAATAFAVPHLKKRDSVYGFDVSHYQSSVDFDAAYNDGGLRFVYIKATEGTTYKDPMFSVSPSSPLLTAGILLSCNSSRTMKMLPTLASFAAATTSPMATRPPPTKPTSSQTTAVAGQTMASRFQVC